MFCIIKNKTRLIRLTDENRRDPESWTPTTEPCRRSRQCFDSNVTALQKLEMEMKTYVLQYGTIVGPIPAIIFTTGWTYSFTTGV